jgi:excisionase family DNA binding protein
MATYSTAQVAKILGIGTDTLHRWLKEKKVAAPKLTFVGGVKVRLWSETDLDIAKRFKAEHYWGKGARRRRAQRDK